MKKKQQKYLIITMIIAMLLFFYFSGFFDTVTPPIPDSWQIDISSTPIGGGTTNPTGTIYVMVNNSLTVNAFSNPNWTFSSWTFNGNTLSQTATITIEPQEIDSTSTLRANFIARLPAFQISPNKVSTTGISTSFALTFTNNEDAAITNVRFKLNDPYGVFTQFGVSYRYKQGSYSWNSFYWTHENNNVLNTYSSSATNFEINGGYIYGGTDTYTIQPHSSINFYCGNDYWGLNPTFSTTIKKTGIYHLTWNIYFEVASGVFSESPNLTISWDVTII